MAISKKEIPLWPIVSASQRKHFLIFPQLWCAPELLQNSFITWKNYRTHQRWALTYFFGLLMNILLIMLNYSKVQWNIWYNRDIFPCLEMKWLVISVLRSAQPPTYAEPCSIGYQAKSQLVPFTSNWVAFIFHLETVVTIPNFMLFWFLP